LNSTTNEPQALPITNRLPIHITNFQFASLPNKIFLSLFFTGKPPKFSKLQITQQ
jgi:hypothetical protein